MVVISRPLTAVGQDARTGCLAVDVHGACAAQARTTAELGTLEAEFVAYRPQQGRIRRKICFHSLAIQCEADHL